MLRILFHFFLGYKIRKQSSKIQAVIGIISSLILGPISAIIVYNDGGLTWHRQNQYIEFKSTIERCTRESWEGVSKDVLYIEFSNYDKKVLFKESNYFLSDIMDDKYLDQLLFLCNSIEKLKVKVIDKDTFTYADLAEIYSIERNIYVLPIDYDLKRYRYNFWIALFFLIVSVYVFARCVFYFVDPKGRDLNGKLCNEFNETKDKGDKDIDTKELTKSFLLNQSDSKNVTEPTVIDYENQHENKSNQLPQNPLTEAFTRKEKAITIKVKEELEDQKEIHTSTDTLKSEQKKTQTNNLHTKKTGSDLKSEHKIPSKKVHQKSVDSGLNKQIPNQETSGKEKTQSISEMADELKKFRLKLEKEGVIVKPKDDE